MFIDICAVYWCIDIPAASHNDQVLITTKLIQGENTASRADFL